MLVAKVRRLTPAHGSVRGRLVRLTHNLVVDATGPPRTRPTDVEDPLERDRRKVGPTGRGRRVLLAVE